MKVLKDIDIYYYDNGVQKLRYIAPVTEGALVHCELMSSHYVKLSFDTAKPINLQIGDFINTQWGRFEITGKYNPNFDGRTYIYEPQFEAYYRKWKNKTCLYIPTKGGNETSFNLTASIGVHARVILKNLAFLGKKDKSYFFNPDYTAPTTLSDNYNSDSVVYSNTDFTVEFDTSVDTKKARLVSYQNTNILDAISSIAQTFECEWWVTDNVIHFGTCKLEQDSNIELKIGVNVDTISASQSQASYATRLYSYGAEKNLPDSYKDNISEDVTKDGVVQKRLMLPTKTELETYSKTSSTAKAAVDNVDKLLDDNGFELIGNALQISGISEQQAIENVLINEDDYPKNIIKIGKISTYQETVDNQETTEEGDKITRTYYRVSGLTLVDEDGNVTGETSFLKDYILEGKELHVIFQSGAMNGLDFVCVFNPDNAPVYKTDSEGHFLDKDGNITTDKSKYVVNPDVQVFEITANENYGRFLPDENLHPDVGDTFVLYNWDATKMSDNLVINASIDLLLDTIEYLKKSMIDPSTYTVTMLANSVFDGTFYSLGTAVRLYHKAYFKDGYRDSRVIGYEIKLDIPYDGAQYIIGEKPSYSKIGELSKQISEVTLNGQSYTGGGAENGGNNIYVVKQNDNTTFSDTNVMSSLRAKMEFLSKTSRDTAQKLIVFAEGLISNAKALFNDAVEVVKDLVVHGNIATEGALATKEVHSPSYNDSSDTGVGMGYHIWVNGTTSNMMIDNLTVRGKWTASVLEVMKLQYSAGNVTIDGAGGEIFAVVPYDKDGNSLVPTDGVNPNLALGTSSEWTDWEQIGEIDKGEKSHSYNLALAETVTFDKSIIFSIEVEIEVVELSSVKKNEVWVTGNNIGVNDWGAGSNNGDVLKAENGIYHLVIYRSKPVRESNIYGFKVSAINCIIKYRYRCAKVEYGKVATPYIANISETAFYRCYFRATDGDRHIENLWHVGDQARCQTFNLTDGTYKNAANRLYFRVVKNVSSEVEKVNGVDCWYIDLSNLQNDTLIADTAVGDTKVGDTVYYRGIMHDKAKDGTVTWASNDTPMKGDQVAHVGNVYDPTRQNAVQLVAVGNEHGLFIYGGINETLSSLSDFLQIRLSPNNTYLNTQFVTYTNGHRENHPYIWCGDFVKGITAHPSEVWQYGGSSWVCNEETTTEPSDGNKAWSVIADKGEQGEQGESAVDVLILTDKGDVLKQGMEETTMTAHVYLGSKEITDTLEPSKFSWVRTSNNPESDTAWNSVHEGFGNVVKVTKSEIFSRSKFECEVDYQQ